MSSRSTTRRDESPKPLGEQMLAFEHERHADRLAAIKRMGARLVLLDAFTPAMAAAGIALNMDEVNDWGGKTVYIGSGSVDHKRNAKLVNVLVAGGMRVAERREHARSFSTFKDVRFELVKGRLRLSICVDGRATHLLEVPACA
ncbi:MAG: hypothetical protein EOO32_00760 [Comamonadaceae bacterium]|nr:MAG: hypothetical protein EOO32_00760 [Comamonadaceae bacterium]